jgi:hypothetical protein
MPAPNLPPKSQAVQGKVEIPSMAYPVQTLERQELDKSKAVIPATPIVIVIPVDNPEHASPNKAHSAK